jgi:hypothetical protein
MLSQPIYDAEMKKYQASETENIDSRIEQAQLEHKASTLQQEARKASTEAEERQLLESAKQAAREAENLEPMPAPRLLATDATPERIASLLYENEERIAIYSDESAALEVMCGRYSSRGTPPNLDVFLNGWSGGYTRPERRSGGYGPVGKAALTICIAAQPSVLRDLARRPVLANRGVLARFLYCLPTSLVGSRLADPPPIDQDKMHQYARNLDALLQLPVPRADSDNEDVPFRKRAISPLIVRLSAEAYQELVAFKSRIEPSLANGGANEDYRAWMAKAASQAIRLAGLLHIAWRRQAGDYRPWESPIPGERMKDAISIVDYAREHMVRAHGFSLALSLHQEQAHKCIRMLRRRAWSSISSRQIQQHAHLAKDDADAVIGLLEDHGYIRSYIPEKCTAIIGSAIF